MGRVAKKTRLRDKAERAVKLQRQDVNEKKSVSSTLASLEAASSLNEGPVPRSTKKLVSTLLGKTDKRNKRLLRRQQLLNRLNKSHQQKLEVQQAIKQAKRGPIANLKDVGLALPDLNLNFSQTENSQQKSKTPTNAVGLGGKRVTSRKGRKAASIKEVAQFKNVLKHDAFIQNPLGVLQQHLQNSLSRQTS